MFCCINGKKYLIVDKYQVAEQTKFEKIGNNEVNKAITKFNKFFKKVKPQNFLELIGFDEVLNKCILIQASPSTTYITPCVDLDEYD